MQHRWRSALSRAYYAAYARVTAALANVPGVTFASGREGPTHARLPGLVETHLSHAGDVRWRVSELVRGLYKARLDADYVPSRDIGAGDAREAVRMMAEVFRLMERV